MEIDDVKMWGESHAKAVPETGGKPRDNNVVPLRRPQAPPVSPSAPPEVQPEDPGPTAA